MTTLPPPGDPRALYVLDLSSFLYRYVHASGGEGGASAVTALIATVMRERRPAYFAVACDSPGPGWRHALYPAYKATRVRDAAVQAAIDRERGLCAHAIQGYALGAPGFEADDVIATVVKRAGAASVGLPVVVLTHDKDLSQLVTADAPTVTVWDGRDAVTGPAEVIAKFGVAPGQLLDYLAIVGDSSDNVPGVRGVGPTGGVALLVKYGTLDAALEALTGAGRAESRPERLLVEQREAALLAREVVRLRTDVPIGVTLGDLRVEW